MKGWIDEMKEQTMKRPASNKRVTLPPTKHDREPVRKMRVIFKNWAPRQEVKERRGPLGWWQRWRRRNVHDANWRGDGFDQMRIDAAVAKRTRKGLRRLEDWWCGGWPNMDHPV